MGVLLLLGTPALHAQEYGLSFTGQPVSKDKRTQLDLNPEGYFSFSNEFELSFQMRIRNELSMTFGYIFRIVDINNNNVDLLFNGPKSNSLQLVCSNELTGISLPFTDSSIYKEWKDINIKFDLREQTIDFTAAGINIRESDIPLVGKVKIFFGKNTFDNVQTTDVPLMDIRDIRILKKNKSLFYFPLDEISGDTVHDQLSRKTALVRNPNWILPAYHNWKEHFTTLLHGFAPFCFASHSEKLYMVGDKQMKVFSIRKDSIQTIEYASDFSGLTTGSQVIYDTIYDRLLCYNLRDRAVYYFDFSRLQWRVLSDATDTPDRFWFHTKYYSGLDTALYVFGGYSQHRYSNLVLRYDLQLFRWDTIPTIGDVFYPRMHAALGAMKDTVYILGGFGSAAGDQVVNPRHYNDLLAFSIKEKKFVKKYDFIAPTTDIDFAHSMLFDQESRSFYVLASSIFQYESYLQILKGNLDDPDLRLLGDQIPYLFHNENSFSDLFFADAQGKLIAVTSLADREKNETEFKVYTISYPPIPFLDGQRRMKNFFSNPAVIGLLLLLGLILLFTVARWILRRSMNIVDPASLEREPGKEPILPGAGRPAAGENLQEPVETPDRSEAGFHGGIRKEKRANSILFFGGFQVIDNSGEDITRKFSPLLKELFLLIFLYSVKGKGVSVQRLTELLWFPMDTKSAKNNRAVNIAKLKHLLGKIESCELTRKTEYWQILFDDTKVYSDYHICQNLTSNIASITGNELEKLLLIIKSGPMLGNVGYEWLDEFKLECSNQITDVLINYLEKENGTAEPELMIRIADAILIFDIMHEEAISIKCRALTALGKHSLAKEIFNKFARDYQSLYDEPYKNSFTDIIKHNS